MSEHVYYCPVRNELIVLDDYDHWLTRQNNWMGWKYLGEL